MTDNCHKTHDIQVKNFGCRLNSYEGTLIKSQLTKMAGEHGQQELHCVVINSCAVTSDAEKKVRQAIRKAARDYPHHKIIVTGCASHIDPDAYQSMECVDAVVGNDVKTAASSYDFLMGKNAKKESAIACALPLKKALPTGKASTTYRHAGLIGFNEMLKHFSFFGNVGLRPFALRAAFFSFFISLGHACIQNLNRKNKKEKARLARHGEATLQGLKYHARPISLGRNAEAFLFLRELGLAPICAAARAFFSFFFNLGHACIQNLNRKNKKQKTSTENFNGKILAPTDRVRAYLEIQNGCDHRCSFCVIPFGRGDSRSLSATEILQQIDSLSQQGVKEVTLSGVDITSYNAGGGGGLGNLLKRICTNFPHMKLRLSSLDGIELDEDFLQSFADYEQICPHLHLSLQSGNDLILKRMKRRHSRYDAITVIENLRQVRKDVVFGADFICGFPTENEAMFADTCSLVQEANITWLHVFPYSARAHTPAARIPNQVPMSVRKERVRQLRKLAMTQAQNYMASMVGSEQKILLEQSGGGYTDTYAPVRLAGEDDFANATVGDIYNMRIIGTEKNSLLAELI